MTVGGEVIAVGGEVITVDGEAAVVGGEAIEAARRGALDRAEECPEYCIDCL